MPVSIDVCNECVHVCMKTEKHESLSLSVMHESPHMLVCINVARQASVYTFYIYIYISMSPYIYSHKYMYVCM